jgi:hypothetical protein
LKIERKKERNEVVGEKPANRRVACLIERERKKENLK